jgi:plasmid stability protein
MAGQLIVRNLEDEVLEALRKRAARHGRSAEAEHRLILRAALLSPPAKPKLSLKELILAIPKAENESEDDEDFERPRSLAREVDL